MSNNLISLDFVQPLLGWLAVLSLVTFVLSIVLIPWAVGRLPQDCFLRLYHNDKDKPPATLRLILIVIFRNILGMVLLLAGIAMLFLPGQGLLTILLGALLISFPGKHKLMHSLVCRPKIQHALNWLRQKTGKPSFIWP